jgi:hypothetical protein
MLKRWGEEPLRFVAFLMLGMKRTAVEDTHAKSVVLLTSRHFIPLRHFAATFAQTASSLFPPDESSPFPLARAASPPPSPPAYFRLRLYACYDHVLSGS